MPLPPALAAKLSKRGILTPKQKQPTDKKIDYKGLSTCPNKHNIYHECNHWCEMHWKGVPTPDPRYVRNMQKLLGRYPLPNNWTEIFDKGVGRYYYWNMENDLVSWLPPKHPKAMQTQSAAKLREKRLKEEKDDREDKDKREKDSSKEYDREKERHGDKESDEDDRGHRLKYSERDRRDRDRDRDSRDERRRERDRDRRDDRYRKRPKRDDIIDPMDPAAYSDIPVGTWSDGLENNKTRADNTASGVLYQQRPYPAPGEVLAANKEKSKKRDN